MADGVLGLVFICKVSYQQQQWFPTTTYCQPCTSCLFVVDEGAQGIGVNYGLLGNNLPPPDKVIGLLKSRNIQKVRIYDPNHDVLKALESSNIQVIVGVRNEELQQLATNPESATAWVSTHILPHYPAVSFRCIATGNEVITGPLASYVLDAMQNLDAALKAANINVPVSTAISFAAIGTSYPPSIGSFRDATLMAPIVSFLASHDSPLLVNMYPYFAYSGNPAQIQLDYALATANNVVVTDEPYQYKNLFDAMVDVVNAALEKLGGQTVSVVASESGWPSDGGLDICNLQ